ncbi:GNAT family N-acetyltransferase [uncultured Xylophilus sp.]|uniref:peptidogalycan biosysnthesis protein n=1 Tax=uncultured Xylophilus sp. TaxID=296832 RepID=UPI0025EF0F65|nr:GNAT family N-acetyltransferase [uncultured Xylophilus sp.]
MRCLNQIEPGVLIRQFLAHPPDGFVPTAELGAGQPAFVAPFDLLTTVDAADKQRIAALPFYRHWSRWLRIRTAFVGTTVTEYAVFAAGTAPEALAAAVRERLGRRCRLAIVKDIPQRSPLLSDDENAQADALAAACAAQGFVLVEGQALAYVAIDFPDIAAYLARLSTGRRKNLQRKWRSRALLDVRRIPTGEAFADEAVVDAYYALYEGVFAQSEVHFDRLGRAFFAAVLRDAASGGIVFEYRRRQPDGTEGPLVGWNLCFEYGGRLIDKYIGFAYPAAREVDLYFVSWLLNLEYAVERGLTHYVAGWTDPEVKAQLGARFTLTRHAVWVRNPLLRALARRFAGVFESDSRWAAP